MKLPLLGQGPLDAIKYDPALEPLPAPARAALDRMTHERAYATFRLALVGPAEGAPAEAAPRSPADESVEFERRGDEGIGE